MVNLKPITTACRLYGQSFYALLPFSLIFVILLHLMHMPFLHNEVVFLGVLTLPVFIGWLLMLDNARQGKSYSVIEIIDLILSKFLSLIAVFFSMLLIPSIILCVGIMIALFLEMKNVDPTGILLFRIFIGLCIVITMVPKSMAPLLIFTDFLDPNAALEKSEELVKAHFINTLFYELYAIAFFGLLLTASSWLPWLIPGLPLSPLALSLGCEGLTALLGPWSIALWLGQLSFLQTTSSSTSSTS